MLRYIALVCYNRLQSFGRGLRLGSGVDWVETNAAPIVTEFDVSWAVSAPVTHREANYQTLYFTLLYHHHKLISSAADMAQILHKRDSLYNLLLCE